MSIRSGAAPLPSSNANGYQNIPADTPAPPEVRTRVLSLARGEEKPTISPSRAVRRFPRRAGNSDHDRGGGLFEPAVLRRLEGTGRVGCRHISVLPTLQNDMVAVN